MSDLPLGASTWCFNGYISPEDKAVLDGVTPYADGSIQRLHDYFAELVDSILNSEIQSVELWSSEAYKDDKVFSELKRLADAGRISSTHAPFGTTLDISSMDEGARRAGVQACISAAEILSSLDGNTLVVHGSSPINEPSTRGERVSRSAASITDIADQCGQLGLNVAVELLPAAHAGNCAEELLSLLQMVGRPNVGVCIDVNHVFPPDDLIPSVEALGPHILTLHISDYDGIERHWLPMRGIIDWPGLIQTLRRVGYQGPFMYEARFEASGIPEAVSILEENYRTLM